MKTASDLQAGRELDALVAEKVFGRLVEAGVMSIAGPDPERFPKNYLHCVWGPVPRYSTDRTAALEVVDRLTERGFYVSMSRSARMNWDVRGWTEDNRHRGIAHADDLALAICRFALQSGVLSALRPAEHERGQP